MTTTLPRLSRPSLSGQLSVPPTGSSTLPSPTRKVSTPNPQVPTTPKTLRRPSSYANLQLASARQSQSIAAVADLPRTNSSGRISTFSNPPSSPSPLSIRTSNVNSRDSSSQLRSPSAVKVSSPLSPERSGLKKPRASLGPYEGFSTPTARVSSTSLYAPSPLDNRSSSSLGSHNADATGSSSLEIGFDGDGKGNVLVSVRVRPDGADAPPQAGSEWTVESHKNLLRWNGKEGGDYYYDSVFSHTDQNSKVYETSCKRLVRRVMEGYHGTIFAYGMTGTGKTYSMQGGPNSPGVIPLAITDIFSFIRETPHREFLLRVSYLEIYNEKIHDLLSISPTGNGILGQQAEEIKLREDSKRGVYATPLKEEIVQSPAQLLRVIARGDLARKTASTQFNARSSRSHAVVQIVVESRDRIPGASPTSSLQIDSSKPGQGGVGGVRVSTLSLIDLAGSERAAETKERRQEGSHINRSLLTLGTVISRLSGDKDKDSSKEKDTNHIPYRDSKLTRLLQPALSGNSLISILCTVTTSGNHAENLNTLKFGARAKNNIVSHAKKAEESVVADAGSKVLLERYRHEIAELRGQLESQVKFQMVAEDEQALRHEEQLVEIQLARTALKERIEHLNRLILSSKSTGVNNTLSIMGRYSGMSGHSGGHNSVQMASNNPQTAQASRTFSSSTFASIGPPPDFPPSDPESDDSAGEYGDGTASLQAQIRALQGDNADKTRYITTLEKRLLQARRASTSRTSLGLSTPPRGVIMPNGQQDEGTAGALLREKDAEIANLRAQLDDKERMVSALRSSARQRDIADLRVQKTRTKSVDDLLSSKRRTNNSTGARSLGDAGETAVHEEEDDESYESNRAALEKVMTSLRHSVRDSKRQGLVSMA